MPAAKDELTQPELLYQTVENDILKKIVSGELPGGSQIPTETELCKQYKVSRITVRRAVQNLIDQNLLYRLRGKGTFVNPSKLTLKRGTSTIFNLSSGPQYGDKTTKSILETGLIKADAHIVRELKIDNGTVVQRVARLVYIENAPCAIDTVYATQGTLPGLLELLTDNASLFDLIANHYSIATGIEKLKITAGIAGLQEANLLGYIVGAPVSVVEHVTYACDEMPLHYSKTVWRADASSFEFSISKDGRLL